MSQSFKFDLFQNFIKEAQTKMKADEFCDVTLVSEDSHKIRAHRVILSSNSKVFKNMLINEQHPHPLIFMRGVNKSVLEALIDFIYTGEVKVESKDVESFLKLNTDLELFGVDTKTIQRERVSQNAKKCKYWNCRFCKKGRHCIWTHPEGDCKQYLEAGRCRDKDCSYRHCRVCRYWLEVGCTSK